MAHSNYKVVILGAGSAGISVAAKLNRLLPEGSMAIVDPSENHYYQPLWTLVGAGLATKESTERKQKDLIPDHVTWIKESVVSIDPKNNKVQLSHDHTISYEYLIVATGLKLNWDKIEGVSGNLGKNGLCTIYEYDQVDQTFQMIKNFQGGVALFVMPPVPIKCAGAPQKIMYLAENIFRNNGVRHKSQVQFATAGKVMFGVPSFSKALDVIVKERNIEPLFSHKIAAVDAHQKIAHFDVTNAEGQISRKSIKYDLLHIVPTMSAHPFISESGLAVAEGDQKGWLAVDKFTLQHITYPNIFGLGDVTGVPNSKTGAAVRKQYPVVAENLLSVMSGKKPIMHYDGYSSCPLVTEIGKVMLAEFGYDGKLMPTFPLDATIPRRSYWHLKKDLLPTLYWQLMLRGLG